MNLHTRTRQIPHTPTRANLAQRLIWSLVIVLYTFTLQADEIYFNHLSSDQGLSQINVMSIYQDERGTMWFGTAEGICRYNGVEVETFNASQENEGFTQNDIYSICGDGEGNIYIKAEFDLIGYNLRTEKFYTIKQGGVLSICYQNHTLWFATADGIYTYTANQIEKYCSVDSQTVGKITSLLVCANGELWISSDKGITTIAHRKIAHRLLKDIDIYTLYQTKNNDIWVGSTTDGVYVLNANRTIQSHFTHHAGSNSVSNNQIRTIIEDRSGQLWVGTFLGLNSYNPQSNQWLNYIHKDNMPNSISHTSVFSLYEDMQGTIWVGTYFGGVNYFNPAVKRIQFYDSNPLISNRLSYPFVGNMVEDKHHNLWICTEGGGLNGLNLKTRALSHYFDESDPHGLGTKYNLKSIWYDKERDLLYLGVHNEGIYLFDIQTNKHRKLDTNRSFGPSNAIRSMQYYHNNLILLTASGISRLDLTDHRVYEFSSDPIITQALHEHMVYYFFIDSKDRIWLSSQHGLRCIDLPSKAVKDYTYDATNPHSFGKFRVNTILETKTKALYLGTSGSGLFKFRPDTDDFINITQRDLGLIHNFSYHVTETSSGNLMLLSNVGVTIFNPQDSNQIVFQSPSDFPVQHFFHGSSGYITSDHEIFIGGVNGLASTFESQLCHIEAKEYNFYFDRLFVNNTRISPNDDSRILKQTLSLCHTLNLKHNQNNIVIQFAGSNYIKNSEVEYEYKMENFDTGWNKASFHTITYTNIPPGKYKLLLREVNSNLNSGQTIHREMNISVSPPFYRTIWAYAVYGALLVLVLIISIRFFIWREKLKMAVEIERKEKEQNEILNQVKLRFFTNVSHELRTPLTLILGQLDILLQNDSMNKSVHQKLGSIYKNADHMRNLISELLDFRKQEQGFYPLKLQRIELVKQLKDIYNSFEEYAKKRSISYSFEAAEEEIELYVDPNQLHKAMFNLLSNAFKYTSAGEQIKVRTYMEQKYVVVQVEDSGIGIPTESLDKIFERFYQVEYKSSGFSLGSGIGLALVKEIVKSHHGTIAVRSALDKGSIFEIRLPLGKAHFADELIEETLTPDAPLSLFAEADHAAHRLKEQGEQQEKQQGEQHTILIVEDNEDLLQMLVESFAVRYVVHQAKNGLEGLRKAVELQPDIVLSDVMMPELSGKEMCFKIKNNIHISHIPVVLLTAQDTPDQTIEGYMYGADAYFTKPFNMEVLISTCNSIVTNRRLLYQHMTKQQTQVVTFDILSEQDQSLIDKATAIIAKNFDNAEFSMDTLAAELAIGRNKLYTRIKEITTLTPNEFALSIKLGEAQRLLENSPHLNISDIAVQLGFSSAKYFTKCFRTFYGVAPTQWRKTISDG